MTAIIAEPKELLAVIEDRQGRRYFRYSFDVHTFSPWRLVGAVHTDTEEDYRWEDLTDTREPYLVISEGLPELRQDRTWVRPEFADRGL